MLKPKSSIAQSLPHELLELIFTSVVQIEKAEARANFDEARYSYGPPSRKVGISLETVERQFLGSSVCVLPCLTVCKQWHP